ncbi:MAG: 50S ribosomal protein L21 [Candidatus Levybacteria bacterium]|nr:50S ribosomal protein L21 [Candidatus Levybacteria bacterium]
MNYAVIKTGGKQYRVSEGDVISIERVPGEVNDQITFSQVLLVTKEDESIFGDPFVSGLSVTGKVVEHLKGEKIRVAKYKAKARYRRVTGHRQLLSKVQISSIGDKKTEKKVPPKAKTPTKK